MAKTGKKSQKGEAESEWGEVKSAAIGTKLTPVGKELFNLRFTEMSLAEIIERLGRGHLKLSPSQPSQLAKAIASELANRKMTLQEFSKLVDISADRLLTFFDSAEQPTESELFLLKTFIKQDIVPNENPKTIKELLAASLSQEALTIDALSKVTRIPETRIESILQGERPEHGELSLLARFLQKDIEELGQMCKREFNGEKQEVRNGK